MHLDRPENVNGKENSGTCLPTQAKELLVVIKLLVLGLLKLRYKAPRYTCILGTLKNASAVHVQLLISNMHYRWYTFWK